MSSIEIDGVNGIIKSTVSDADITIKGNDGGSEISALTFDMSSGGQLLAAPLGVSVPSYSFSNDTNTGMTRPTSDTLQFVTAGSERVRIASDGDIGLGTSDPTQNLELVVSKTASIPTDGSIGSTNNGAACGMGIHNENNSAVYSGLNFETRTTHASRWLIGNEWKSSYNGDLFFRARDGASSSSEILRLKSDGKVGIGTSSPSAKMHVESDAGGVKLLTRGASSSTTTSNDADELFVDNAGNSGITIGSGTSSLGSIHFGDSGDNDIGKIVYNHNGNSLAFTTNTSERMRIDSSGRIGIANTSPGSFNSQGQNLVIGSGSGDAGMTIYSGSGSDDSGNIFFADGTSGSDPVRGGITYKHDDNAMLFRINDVNSIRIPPEGNLTREGTGAVSMRIGSTNAGGAFLLLDGDSNGDFSGSDYSYVAHDSAGRLEIFQDSPSGTNQIRFHTAAVERGRFIGGGALLIGTTAQKSDELFCVATGANSKVVYIDNSQASYAQDLIRGDVNRAANASYGFLRFMSGGEADTEFNFTGTGTAYADGTWEPNGADYAEYFEWKDDNSSDEDRRGYSVVLDGNKIVKATDSDDADKIIGVISDTAGFVGDSAWNKWNQKHLKDDFGSYIYEDYTQTEWKETTIIDGVEDIKEHTYQTDLIPSDLTVPEDAIVTSKDEDGNNLQRRKVNPDWNKDTTYIPREDRKEWDTVGLMGKLRLRKGQPTGTNWIKMRDISDTVEEWLVR